jgi:hypothetical protein
VHSPADNVGNWLRPAGVDDGLVTKNLAAASHVVGATFVPLCPGRRDHSGIDRDSGTRRVFMPCLGAGKNR